MRVHPEYFPKERYSRVWSPAAGFGRRLENVPSQRRSTVRRSPTPDTHCYFDTHFPVSGQHNTDLAPPSSGSIEVCMPHVSAGEKQDEQVFYRRTTLKGTDPFPAYRTLCLLGPDTGEARTIRRQGENCHDRRPESLRVHEGKGQGRRRMEIGTCSQRGRPTSCLEPSEMRSACQLTIEH